MADERMIFPTETVLALVTGKKDADTGDLVAFLLGRPVANAQEARAAAPFAAAWLARWQPKLMELELTDDADWQQLSAKAKSRFGDHISIVAMGGPLKNLTNSVLDTLDRAKESLLRQTDAAAKLEQQVKELAPLADTLKALQKKNDELESKLKASKSDLAAAQRKLNEFEGKIAIDDSELRQTINDAIKAALKDGLKGVAASSADVALAEAEMPTAQAAAPAQEEDEWGFKSKRSKNNDW